MFLCNRLHSTFLQNFKKNDQKAYEILFVTFLGLSPQASRHALSQPYLTGVFLGSSLGLILGLGVAVGAYALGLRDPVGPGARCVLWGAGLGADGAKSSQRSEVKTTLGLLSESSHLRPLGFPAFSRILRRYCRSKNIIDMCLSTLELCSVAFKKFISELTAAVEQCAETQSEKDAMKLQVNALRSQQQNRLYESGIIQTIATAITLTPSTPDIGITILRAVNILQGIWSARKHSALAIPLFTVDCMKQVCVRGMESAVRTIQVVFQQNAWGMRQSLKVQADLFVHSLRLLKLLSMQDSSLEPHAALLEEPRNITRQLFQSHAVGTKLICWTLLKEQYDLDCSCKNTESSCLKSDAKWAFWAIFTSICQFEELGLSSCSHGSVQFGDLIAPSSQCTLQFISIAAFFEAVAEAVAVAIQCGAKAPPHAHLGHWRDAPSSNPQSLCDQTCTHRGIRVSGHSHYRL